MSRIGGPIDPAALQKIEQRAWQNVSYQVRNIEVAAAGLGDGFMIGDTPIERTLLIAVWMEIFYGGHEFKHFLPIRGRNAAADQARGDDLRYVFCCAQQDVLGCRVDFVFSVGKQRSPATTLIVECDGHAFHAMTREQASRDRSRDRAFQEAGYKVFRFTGSEIWRDPPAQADAIVRWLSASLPQVRAEIEAASER